MEGPGEVLVAGGAFAAFVGAAITLVRIALGAERRRADDWRVAAETNAEANKILTAHVGKLVSSVEQLAVSQREMMALLQSMAGGRGPT